MSLQPVLTQAGLIKLQAAKAGGPNVVLTTVALGSAARLPSGVEVALTTPICTSPITSATLEPSTGQLDLTAMIDGADVGLVADHVVREIGFVDQDGALIFYWSTLGTIGAITPITAFSLSFSIALAPADAAVIEIVDQGPPWGVLFETRLLAAERSGWRNLFLSQS